MVIVIIVAGLAYQYWPKQGLQPVQSSVPEVPDSSMQSPLETVPEANLPDNDMAIRANPQYAQDTRDVSKLNQSLATPLMIESMPANMASSEQLSQTESTLQSPEIKAAESMPVKSEEVPVESAASAPADDGQITLVVTEASWIEVKDKTGNKLISRVLEQETVDLTGSPPLAVRIGNVAGTSLRFNEKPVDLKAYQQNNIARLTLGAES